MKLNDSPIFKVQKNKEKIYNIENIKIYFVLISFNSLLATETFIHFDWSSEQKKSQNNKKHRNIKVHQKLLFFMSLRYKE